MWKKGVGDISYPAAVVVASTVAVYIAAASGNAAVVATSVGIAAVLVTPVVARTVS